MGLFDKIKNALFEEEYVEIEEKPKKSKKESVKSAEVERPIAKKVVLPEKRDIRVDELDEDELIDEDFEIAPKKVREVEPVASERQDFKVMDEDDFKVEDSYQSSEPKIVKVIEKDEDLPPINDEVRYYQGKKEKQGYGMSDAPKISVPEYGKSYEVNRASYGGAYERKEDRTHFKPSPIISPIYGILDKNYKKEDVVTKKEIRLTSSYARENLSVDDVRKKAYGSLSDDIEKELDTFDSKTLDSFDADVTENLLVDLSDEADKPTVKEVTMGDALEYFEDLGLEYNVDYVDANKEKTVVGRRSRDSYDEVLDIKAEEKVVEEVKPVVVKENIEDDPVIAKVDVSIDTEDNLFDLIDSMYKDND